MLYSKLDFGKSPKFELQNSFTLVVWQYFVYDTGVRQGITFKKLLLSEHISFLDGSLDRNMYL